MPGRLVLSDGDQVRNLLGRYCERLDAGDFDGVGELFATGRLTTEDSVVLATGATEVADFYRRGTRLHEGSPRTKHLVVDTVLEPGSDGVVDRRPVVLRRAAGRRRAAPAAAHHRRAVRRLVRPRRRRLDMGRAPVRGRPAGRPLAPPGVPAVSVALVTGAASGIGAAVGRRLRADGYDVVGLDILPAEGVRRCDVTSTAEIDAVVADLDQLDVVANVAGIPQFGRAETITDDEWERVLAVDLTGPFKVVRAALPLLKASRGCIVNLASVAGIQGQAYTAAYSAAKGGLVVLTKALAIELAPDGVRVNCICPGGVDTPLLRQVQFPEDADARLLERLTGPLAGATLATAEQVAEAVAWMVSPAAACITGIALPMDGGRSA